MQEQKDQISDFIEKLIRMMTDFPDLINWGNQGEELVILNQKQFEQKVLHRFFRHGKLESFVRQLNMYGFHKVCRNKNSINFRNKFFFQGNQRNFSHIKRRTKGGEDDQQPVDQVELSFLKLINQKHGDQFPQLPTIVQQILHFKAKSNKTMNKLRKSLDILGRQLNERKSKVVKPTISQIKQMISSIEDSSKKTEMSIQQIIQVLDKESQIVKKEESQNQKVEINGHHQTHHTSPVIPHPINAQLSYPALHSSGDFLGQSFTQVLGFREFLPCALSIQSQISFHDCEEMMFISI